MTRGGGESRIELRCNDDEIYENIPQSLLSYVSVISPLGLAAIILRYKTFIVILGDLLSLGEGGAVEARPRY